MWVLFIYLNNIFTYKILYKPYIAYLRCIPRKEMFLYCLSIIRTDIPKFTSLTFVVLEL